MPRKLEEMNGHMLLDSVIQLSLFGFFIITGFTIILLSAKIYQLIGEDIEYNFEIRTPMAYIANKVRQNDRIGSIKIRQLQGTDALILEEEWEDVSYETWIYVHDDKLREVYVEAGTTLALEDGMELIEAEALNLKWVQKDCLEVQLETKGEQNYELNLKLRTEQGE